MNLSTKQKQHLKGLAHPLKPVVLLGSNGLTEGVLAEIEQALEHHELIKVKIATEDRETKTLIVEAIVRETGACNVQVIGKRWCFIAQLKNVKSRCHAKIILKLHTFAV
ncbi:putative RNA-binding protein [Escherichia coli]|uniref:Putative RNA-binding protein n=1 Tax=Escherichia coli TaxID=562 RepID=A0A377C3E1_ECOLX|nr:putative RNA-binding protein [Escherichia coli]